MDYKVNTSITVAGYGYGTKLYVLLDHVSQFSRAVNGNTAQGVEGDLEQALGPLGDQLDKDIELIRRYWPLFVRAVVDAPDAELLNPNKVSLETMGEIVSRFFVPSTTIQK